jgi:glutaminyl-peptide cyclotransferase
MDDDAAHLDIPTVEDWAKMVTAFVGEWMDLEGYFPHKVLAVDVPGSEKKDEL